MIQAPPAFNQLTWTNCKFHAKCVCVYKWKLFISTQTHTHTHWYRYIEHFSLFAYTSSLWIMYIIHRKFETSTNQDMSIVDYAISVTFDWLVDVHKIKSSANSGENFQYSIIMNWKFTYTIIKIALYAYIDKTNEDERWEQ